MTIFSKNQCFIILLLFGSLTTMRLQYELSLLNPSTGLNDGSIIISLQGDAGPFDVKINPENAIVNEYIEVTDEVVFQKLTEGTYEITITDNFGCVTNFIKELKSDKCPPLIIDLIELNHNALYGLTSSGMIEVELVTEVPQENIETIWYKKDYNNKEYQIALNMLRISDLDEGLYRVEVKIDGDSECKITKKFNVTYCNRLNLGQTHQI